MGCRRFQSLNNSVDFVIRETSRCPFTLDFQSFDTRKLNSSFFHPLKSTLIASDAVLAVSNFIRPEIDVCCVTC